MCAGCLLQYLQRTCSSAYIRRCQRDPCYGGPLNADAPRVPNIQAFVQKSVSRYRLGLDGSTVAQA